jgi:transposase
MAKKRVEVTSEQKYEYARLMVEEGYTNQQIQQLSEASSSAVVRWKAQYKQELSGKTPEGKKAITPEQQRIQELEQLLWRAKRDNEILKKAAALFITQ